MQGKNSVIVDYTEGNILRQIVTFSVPFMLSALLQVMYSLVDSIVVGQYVGSAGLAGVNISAKLTTLVAFGIQGFGSAGQVIISQRLGAKDMSGIRKTIGTLFTLTILFALFFSAVCILLRFPILRLLNTPEEAFESASSYLFICSFGFIFVCGYNAACCILRGSGDSKRPFIIIAAAAVTNLVLDLVLVVGMNMGAAGAALATVISQGISMILCVAIFYKNRAEFDFTFEPSSFRIDREALGLLMKLGVPLALKSCAISLSAVFLNGFINAYGVAASAAYAVGNKLQQIPSIITQGLFSSGSTMIGQNLGAKQYDRICQIVRTILWICVVSFTVIAILFLLFPAFFFRIFTSDPDVIAYAVPFMWVMLVGFIGSAIMCPYYSVVMGVGYATFNLAISVLDGVILRIGLGILLGRTLGMGVVGFYLGSNLAAFGTSIPSLIYYLSGRWKNRSLVNRQG